MSAEYTRPYAETLKARLLEPRRFLLVLAGARQVGKTTLVRQISERLSMPVHIASADEPQLKNRVWIAQQWEIARHMMGKRGGVFVLDEVQKIDGWSETVKRLWDEDTHARRALRVVLLGSAPLLLRKGMTESLAGRFEILHLPHWSAREMRDAFGWDVDTYICYGGYPGAASLIDDPDRWGDYIRNALVETTISRDVFQLARIDKPALLRRVFELGCMYSGQILSFTKMLGQLQDAGNTTTLAHYLELLSASGMVCGLQKWAGETVRRRASSPKLQVYNTALSTALAGYRLQDVRKEPALWGRMVESSVGAHLLNAAASGVIELYYWRDGIHEVDFIVHARRRLIGIEVKSGRPREVLPGLARFRQQFRTDAVLLVGADGIPVNDFLMRPVTDWIAKS
ncbi:MAG: ATP-binding protein [Ignavibacteriae bacterium]|nr:ATP-binding protein [Ignavibacteriota bacterium]